MKQQIAEIDTLLSRICVSGDSVLVLATVRQKLKMVYDAIKEDEEKDG